jgi:hypothetical protein
MAHDRAGHGRSEAAPSKHAAVFFDHKDGNPATQARQFARDVGEMPAELGRAAKLASRGDRPLRPSVPAISGSSRRGRRCRG